MNKITQYFAEIKQELSKVSWSKRDVVIAHTISVFATIIVSILLLAGVDFLFSKLANLIFIGATI